VRVRAFTSGRQSRIRHTVKTVGIAGREACVARKFRFLRWAQIAAVATGTSYAAMIEAQQAGKAQLIEYGPFSYWIALNRGLKIENVGIPITSPNTDGGTADAEPRGDLVLAGDPRTDRTAGQVTGKRVDDFRITAFAHGPSIRHGVVRTTCADSMARLFPDELPYQLSHCRQEAHGGATPRGVMSTDGLARSRDRVLPASGTPGRSCLPGSPSCSASSGTSSRRSTSC
jgi:hypothetical protein